MEIQIERFCSAQQDVATKTTNLKQILEIGVIMKIIKPAQSTILTLLGVKDSGLVNYKKSIYNYIVKFDNKNYLYNTITGMLAILSEDEVSFLNVAENISREKITNQEFLKNRVLVPVEDNETENYLQICRLLKNQQSTDKYQCYTIIPSTVCNARCFYCFEQGMKIVSMDEKLVEDVADFILKTHDNTRISIYWYGGEPLCCHKSISKICSILKENGVDYISTMVTNGYLLNEDIIKTAKNLWNIKKIQFSMDGMGEEHNRRKAFVKPKNDPFTKTIENVELCLKNDIKTTVRINIDNNNIDNTYEFIDYLHDKFSKYNKFMVYVKKLYLSSGGWDAKRSAEEQEKLQKHAIELTKYIYSLNLAAPPKIKTKFTLDRCAASRSDSITVDSEGNLYTCCHCIDKPIGTIYEGVTNREIQTKWTRPTEIMEKCQKCVFLPKCTFLSLCPDNIGDCYEERKRTTDLAIQFGVHE